MGGAIALRGYPDRGLWGDVAVLFDCVQEPHSFIEGCIELGTFHHYLKGQQGRSPKVLL